LLVGGRVLIDSEEDTFFTTKYHAKVLKNLLSRYRHTF